MSTSTSKPPVAKFILPGTWHEIDLSDPTQTKQRIHEFVARQVGPRDDFATLRADLRNKLSEASSRALQGGASTFFFATEVTEGIPFSGSLTVMWPDIPLPGEGKLAMDAIQRNLTSNYAQTQVTRLELHTQPMIRTVEVHSTSQVDPRTHEPVELESVECDFYVQEPTTRRLVVLNFASSMSMFKDPVVELFTAIAGSLHWEDATTQQGSITSE